MTTCAPSLAKQSTAARPMPREPPVTTATRSLRFSDSITNVLTPADAGGPTIEQPRQLFAPPSCGPRSPALHRQTSQTGRARNHLAANRVRDAIARPPQNDLRADLPPLRPCHPAPTPSPPIPCPRFPSPGDDDC